MKPSEALSAIRLLADETEEAERRASNCRFRLDRIMVTIDQGRSIVDAGREAAELLGLDRDEQIEEPAPSIEAKPDDAPYGRRADGTPKARPGRKTKTPEAMARLAAQPRSKPAHGDTSLGEYPKREELERAGKIVPIDSSGVHVDVSDLAKASVVQEKNAADIRILTGVLTAHGPCPPSVLLHRSGLDPDTIGAHVRAAAVIESYDGEYAIEGGKLMPSIMIRLISQRLS